jgi:hypothetical protein
MRKIAEGMYYKEHSYSKENLTVYGDSTTLKDSEGGTVQSEDATLV